MARTHKMNMCHSAKAAALAASRDQGTRSASCRPCCSLSRRTLRTRFAESAFTINNLFLREAARAVRQSFLTLPTPVLLRKRATGYTFWCAISEFLRCRELAKRFIRHLMAEDHSGL